MKIAIKRIYLENYKKFEEENTFEFSERTKISGKNKEGKSTIMNAYMEVMTGKQVDGTQPDAIRPHNSEGKDLNRADVIREIVLDVNGSEISIKKITKQKWRKPHGQTEEVLDGNQVEYEIDGYSYKPKKFEEYMKGLADPEILLTCSNPNPFLSVLKKSTADARKLLEKLSGFDLAAFLESNPEYKIVESISKGHSVEDAMKKLRKQLNDQKKKLTQKETELKYEQTRDSGEIEDTENLECQKKELNERISELDSLEKSLDDVAKNYDAASEELLDLKNKLKEFVFHAGSELRGKREEISNQIHALNAQNTEYANNLKMVELELIHSKMAVDRHKAELENARKEYSNEASKRFNETKLHEIEAETFNEDDFICPECGQLRPEEQRNNMKETFEQSKERRIAEQIKAKTLFEETQKNTLEKITEFGNAAADALNEARKIYNTDLEKIGELKQNIMTTSAEIVKVEKMLSEMPENVDLSDSEAYQRLSKQVKDKEFVLSTINNGSEKRQEYRNQRYDYMKQLSNINASIKKIEKDAELKERKLAELNGEFSAQKQFVADIERQIDIISQFSIKKNAALAEKINPFFNHFKFRFLDFTFEGNPVETCRMICGGTDYGDLNGGDRKLLEADLCVGLQKMNGLNLPIWIDEANTVDSWRIPTDLEQQLILIHRNDEELKVSEF